MPTSPVAPRSDFPALERNLGDVALTYLDSAATSLKPQCVIDAEADFYARLDGAVHRGAHQVAVEATEIYEGTRAKFAAFVGASTDEIIWAKNATEAINLVAYSLLNASIDERLKPGSVDERLLIREGDTIAVTQAEHHANFVPWQQLAARAGANFHVVPVLADGTIDYAALAELPERTRVLAFTQASNVTGALTDVAAMVAAAKERGALTVMDACQSAAHLPLDLDASGVDFAAMSAHKMLGPTGVGVLFGRSSLLAAMPPFITGGSMVAIVTAEATRYMPAPMKFEAGTQMTAQIAGLNAAIDYLRGLGMDNVARYDLELGDYLLDAVRAVPGTRIIGPESGERLGLVAFQLGDVHPHDVGQYLDAAGIAVRVGHHCAQPVHRALGVQSSTRASIGPYTSRADIDRFADRLAGVLPFFQGTA